MKHMLMSTTVALVMAMMMVAAAAPAFAAWGANGCKEVDVILSTEFAPQFADKDRNGDGSVCSVSQSNRPRAYDNRTA